MTGSAIGASLKFPSTSLQQFPGVTFAGNGGCSPHSNKDYLALRTFLVPTLETEGPAIRWYRQTSDGSDTIPSVATYLDLQVRSLPRSPRTGWPAISGSAVGAANNTVEMRMLASLIPGDAVTGHDPILCSFANTSFNEEVLDVLCPP